MTIEYLTALRDNPIVGDYTNDGIPESEIHDLENLYNGGNLFPKVLKELLFLAGNYCGYLDYSVFDSQQEMQTEIIAELASDGLIISRPHYFIDLCAYDNPIFIYLDEGDNPKLYQITDPTNPNSYQEKVAGGQRTIKNFIEKGIELYKQGYGPF